MGGYLGAKSVSTFFPKARVFLGVQRKKIIQTLSMSNNVLRQQQCQLVLLTSLASQTLTTLSVDVVVVSEKSIGRKIKEILGA